MQAINRIQDAMINANADMQGAMVVVSANAHRAYRSYEPCFTRPVSKCPGTTSFLKLSTPERLLKRSEPTLTEVGAGTDGPTGRRWRLGSHHHQMPAMVWAMMVVNRQVCG